MVTLNTQAASLNPVPTKSTFTPSFTSHPSLSSFNVPYKTYISNHLKAESSPELAYRYIAVGALVFSNHHHNNADVSVNPNSHNNSKSSFPPSEPRILLLRRSPTDSLPLRWEPPGGATDPEDPSILHACARELHEEAGLLATSITSVVQPDGRLFFTGNGNLVCKFEFVVSVEGEGEGMPKVKLDPEEHVDFVWATEGDCRERQVMRGEEVVELNFTFKEQRESVLEAFRLVREMRTAGGVE